MKKLLLLSLGLLALPATAHADEPYCREFTNNVIVGSHVQESYGTACLQPDGAWQIVSEAPKRAVTFHDSPPLTVVQQRFWDSRAHYRYYPQPTSSLVLGVNLNNGSFFTTSYTHDRYEDHYGGRHDHGHTSRHDNHRDHGRRGWRD